MRLRKSSLFAAIAGFTLVLVGCGDDAKPPPPPECSAGSAPNFVRQWGKFGTGHGEFNQPAGVAVGPGGQVYVADSGNGCIQMFEADGTFVRRWYLEAVPGGVAGPRGITVDSQTGDVYVAVTESHYIDKSRSNGALVWQCGGDGPELGRFIYPKGLAVGAGGNIFVADTGNDRIQILSGNGPGLSGECTCLSAWGVCQQVNFSEPEGVAVDGAGNVYVADTRNNRIAKFDNSGQCVATWGTLGSGNGQLRSPCGIGIDPDGNVYVADTYNNRIQKFTGNGTFVAWWGCSGAEQGEFKEPEGVAIGPDGDIYVADTKNHRIQQFVY